MIPAHRDAARDPKVEGAPLRVYDYLLHELDTEDYSAVKVASVANALRMKDITVYRALNRLVECGYLRRSGTERVRTYRLVYARVA